MTSDGWLAELTGVRTSKRNYYPEYRRTSAGLGRALAALEAISQTLCMTTCGARSLIEAFLEALRLQFAPALTVMTLRPEAFGGSVPAVLALDAAGSLIDDERDLPEPASAVVSTLRSHDGWLVAPMRRSEEVVGAIALWNPVSEDDDSDVVILAALGNQALTAINNACLYEESEQLRSRIAAVYREAEHHARDLEERSAQLQTVQRHLTEARERQLLTIERERIARELHDSVAQHLLSIGMHLEWCRALATELPPLHERIRLAKELARDAVGHIRDAIFTLSRVEHGGNGVLADALDELATATAGMCGVPVDIRVTGDLQRLDPIVEHGLQRIAQEAVSNAARHAGGSRIRLTVRAEEARALLSVTDDGHGCAAELRRRLSDEQGRAGAHHGLDNMAARARELGGTLSIRRARGGGIVVLARVPLRTP